MKLNLFNFQQNAVDQLHQYCHIAQDSYQRTRVPQIISFTAPTGSGKTIVSSALIEQLYRGGNCYPEQPEAIIIWLSDSPQLNQQSRIKIETKADRIAIGSCVTIEEDSFDCETLEEGHIYFLNTQKLSKSSNLTKHSDNRQYTIWETLKNTIAEKGDRLYMIIDEAHRGAKTDQTTIMQSFIKGGDMMPPMPVVIGMSATIERFDKLAKGVNANPYYVRIKPEDVRKSGLLKDVIEIYSPSMSLKNKELGVLQAAADEWRDKVLHWNTYCREQHHSYINPIFVIQVEAGTAGRVSATDLGECLKTIEERTGTTFVPGEVVHAFGEKNTITANGLDIQYKEPSDIQDDRNIRVVFFKESLSTGWDCPRAEVMMSFRRATDSTYIAQLLGRMIRTPKQCRILVDESLNIVNLYLPNFETSTVEKVVDELKKSECDDIPIETGEVGGRSRIIHATVRPHPVRIVPPAVSSHSSTEKQGDEVPLEMEPYPSAPTPQQTSAQPTRLTETPQQPYQQPTPKAPTEEQAKEEPVEDKAQFDRIEVLTAINMMGLQSYKGRGGVRMKCYTQSLFDLMHLLSQTGIWRDAQAVILREVVTFIHEYALNLKKNNLFEEKAKKVLEIELFKRAYDPFGEEIVNNGQKSLFTSSNADLERQFRRADIALFNEGLGNVYGRYYINPEDEDAHKIEFILFAGNQEKINELEVYAKQRFCDLCDGFRPKMLDLTEQERSKFEKIVLDSDDISQHFFILPNDAVFSQDPIGEEYIDHLLVDDRTGSIRFKLNSWEEAVLNEERGMPGYVCWVRNQPRKDWALGIPYELNGNRKLMYPDFIIIRKNEEGNYVADILEPHGDQNADSLPKAKGLAEYAAQNYKVGRVQLIRVKKDTVTHEAICRRLDLCKTAVKNKIKKCVDSEDLDKIFSTDGTSMTHLNNTVKQATSTAHTTYNVYGDLNIDNIEKVDSIGNK